MDIRFIASAAPLAGVVVVPVAADGVLLPHGRSLDEGIGGLLTSAIARQPRFSGKKDELLSVNGLMHDTLDSVILCGTGDIAAMKKADYRNLGAAIGVHLQTAGYEMVMLDARDFPSVASIAQTAFGMMSRLYRFDRYRTTLKPEQKMALQTVEIMVGDVAAVTAIWHSLAAVTRGVTLARDMVMQAPNKLYPATFVEQVKEAAKDLPLMIHVLDKTRMQELGMGALLAVNQGTNREPFTLVLEYKGLENNETYPLALVGKGVTFDTGGLCIKPGMPPGSWPMADMKFDMAGGAAVAGAMLALAARGAKANVVGLVGLVENTIDADAYLPADVVTTMSGQTVEVLNTDAEGRLVLADVLWYAQETYKPETVVDIATLTGAVLAALSDQYAGVFTDDETLGDALLAAGKDSGDRLWQLPLGAGLDKHLDSLVADMSNVGSGGAGASTAALFIKRFIQKDVKWAHIDMAGMAWSKTAAGISPAGATGYGVHLLDRFVRENYEKKTLPTHD